MIIIQRIETYWTKKSRGMPEAAKRNNVPHAFAIEPIECSGDDILINEVVCSEENGFKPVHTIKELDSISSYWTLNFEKENGELRVVFWYDYNTHGNPVRETYKRKIFSISMSETAVFLINGRFTSYSDQWYKQNVINIGYVEKLNKNLFLKHKVKYCLDKRADLF